MKQWDVSISHKITLMASVEQAVPKDEGNDLLLVTALTRFAIELYKEQVKEKSNGNTFMSPVSISAVLNMALLGARGKTLDEMKTAMCLHPLKDDSKLHQAFSDLISHLKRRNTEVPQDLNEIPFQLHMANRIYGEKSLEILDEFQTSCKKFYNVELHQVSFSFEPAKAADEINSWVLEHTNQKIKDIISPKTIDATTKLILVNAVYFKSAWKNPFQEICTGDKKFFISPADSLRVKTMHQEIENVDYYKSRKISCEVLKLDYVNSALSMFILLPKKSSSLRALEEKLTVNNLDKIYRKLKNRPKVLLWLPKFKIEETMELSDVLTKMGMKTLFEDGSADLSGIDGTRILSASKLMHKACVDVNEEGTEVASGTYVYLGDYGLFGMGRVTCFRVDRPFLFFIREERRKVILFMGRVIRPEYS